MQDAWVRVIRSAKHFGFRSSVRTWLYRIVINRCHDLRASGRLASPRDGRAPEPAAPASGAGPVDDAVLRRAVDGLPGDRRLIVVLCYHRGLSHAQAADVLGIPAGTLKSRLSAALAELRAALASEVRP